jgi:thioesterase domain-containing protein
MAERLVGELSGAQPEGPIYPGGFSFGGLVAFEAARRLRACGREVALLVLLDTFGPGYPRPINRLERERRHLAALRRLDLASGPGHVVERLLNLARRLGLRRDPTLDADRAFEPFRRAAREYLAKPRPYGGKITLFRALMRPALHTCCYADSCNGWREYSPSVEVHGFACRHNDLMEEPWLGQVARAIEPHLRRAALG